jgi:hypothetical protein
MVEWRSIGGRGGGGPFKRSISRSGGIGYMGEWGRQPPAATQHGALSLGDATVWPGN